MDRLFATVLIGALWVFYRDKSKEKYAAITMILLTIMLWSMK